MQNKVAGFNTPVMFGAVILTVGIVYFIGWLIHEIWNFIATPVFRFLEKKIPLPLLKAETSASENGQI